MGIAALGTIGRQELELWRAAGFRTIGYDHDPLVVAGLLEKRGAESESNDLELTADLSSLRECAVLVLCLPTVDAESRPSLAAYERFCAEYSPLTPVEQLIVVASSVPIGFGKWLAHKLGTTRVAHVPERYDPGRSGSFAGIPRLVGAIGNDDRDEVARLYESLGVPAVPVDTIEIAEAAKLLENAFRLVNVAFINEFAQLCSAAGVPASAVIEAASTKPFGFLAHYPGAGAGGLCIPSVPRFLLQEAQRLDVTVSILESALTANDGMPDTVLAMTERMLERPLDPSTTVLIVGATYKPDYPDARGSAALRLIRAFSGKAEVHVPDPFVSERDLPDGVRLHRGAPTASFDVAIVAIRHTNSQLERLSAKRIIDLTRGSVSEAP